ncbi:hypothetical protein GDO81_012772 [Engystomops pustulosus]|uniref:Uncharacterized protein n=1 Tax=Engystomops pustulosus TaxID=76066 RepID=A0AAV7AZ52_ENGPU|nr:hypothetical protein GDO81_012772 [Engystomops pustulosus]
MACLDLPTFPRSRVVKHARQVITIYLLQIYLHNVDLLGGDITWQKQIGACQFCCQLGQSQTWFADFGSTEIIIWEWLIH